MTGNAKSISYAGWKLSDSKTFNRSERLLPSIPNQIIDCICGLEAGARGNQAGNRGWITAPGLPYGLD